MAPEVAYKPEPEGEGGAEQRIPKERVDAMIASAKADAQAKLAAAEERARLESERRRDLEARMQAISAAPAAKPEEKPPLTRAQLRALVDDGKISQDDMDAELERQIEARIAKRVESVHAVKDRSSKINTEIDLYMEKIPDLNDSGSDSRKRVVEEFNRLRKLEYPNDASTELLALRSVFGDPREVKIPETGNQDRETDMTIHSGAGAEPTKEKAKGPGPMKGLEQHHIDYYQHGIDKGRFKGWDDPRLIEIQKRALRKK